jgi:hypothetical protein
MKNKEIKPLNPSMRHFHEPHATLAGTLDMKPMGRSGQDEGNSL